MIVTATIYNSWLSRLSYKGEQRVLVERGGLDEEENKHTETHISSFGICTQ